VLKHLSKWRKFKTWKPTRLGDFRGECSNLASNFSSYLQWAPRCRFVPFSINNEIDARLELSPDDDDDNNNKKNRGHFRHVCILGKINMEFVGPKLVSFTSSLNLRDTTTPERLQTPPSERLDNWREVVRCFILISVHEIIECNRLPSLSSIHFLHKTC
jgi:hypothetical protein